MSLSILHRMTGVMLSVGGLVLTGWLVSVVAGGEAYARTFDLLNGPLGRLLLLGWTFCFFYHLGNGVRHLFWDVGRGFEMRHATMSGMAVVGFSVVMTLAFWSRVLFGGGS